MAEFEQCLEEFGIEEYVVKSWVNKRYHNSFNSFKYLQPMIKQFAQKYGIDEQCLEEIEKKFMSSF